MNIYVELELTTALKNAVREAAVGYNVVFGDEIESQEEKKNAVINSEIIFGNVKEPAWLDEATKLRWMQFSSAGFDAYRAVKTKATVTNMRDYFSEPCAETIVAGILALYRAIPEFTLLKQEKKWVGSAIRNDLFLLNNRNVIILGAGNIGLRIGKILGGFDCRVSYYARSTRHAIINNPEELSIAVPTADIVIGALPGTAETTGLFTNEMIDSMRQNALFCNVGRGNLLQDEGHLVKALMNRRIAGAVLDVTAEEPIPPGHDLWNCPNLILTQHSGGGNLTETEGIVAMFLTNLRGFDVGRAPMNIVNLEKGY